MFALKGAEMLARRAPASQKGGEHMAGLFRQHRISSRLNRLLLATATLGCFGMTAAGAADPSGSEEVIVTAQKREERLVDVPVSISVVGAKTLGSFNLNQSTDLGYLVPNVSFSTESGQRAFSFFIRGIGTTTYSSESLETSSAYVVDGVIYGQGGAAQTDLPDIERIEVLRGPQGTLFGKNASAGVINVVTKKPTKAFEAGARLSYAHPDNERKLSAFVSGPMGDNAGYRISARLNRRDGIVHNFHDGRELNNRNDWGVRGRFDFGQNSDLKLSIIGDYWKSDTRCCLWTLTRAGEPMSYIEQQQYALGNRFGWNPRHLFQNINGESFTKIENAGISAQIDYDLGGGYQLTSISAFRIWNASDWPDTDSQPIDVFDVDPGYMRQQQFSEELRVASPADQFFDFVAGLYIFNQNAHTYSEQILDLRPALFVGRAADVYGNTLNVGVFGQGNLNFTPDFRVIIGGRVLMQRDEASSYRKFFAPDMTPADSNTRDRTYDGYVFRVGVQYDLTETSNVFATVTRGFKGGGYNLTLDQVRLDEVDPEIPTNYEIGYRGSFPDSRFSISLTGFYTPIDDFQVYVNFLDPNDGFTLISAITNAAKVELKGIEAEFMWQPIAGVGWQLSGSFGYLDARYDSYPNSPCYAFQTAQEGCHADNTQDASGNRLPFAPKFSANFVSHYETPIGSNLLAALDINVSYRSKRFTNTPQRPEQYQPSLALVNAAVSLGSEEAGWRVSLFCQNLTDEHFATREFSGFLEFNPATFGDGETAGSMMGYVPYEAQRIIGVSLDVDF
jgi:iron complex outermembrane receptor protein